MAGQRVVFTADPDNIRAILATQFGDYGKGQGFRDDWHPLLGDSVFSMDTEKWQAARQLLRPQFIKNRVSDLLVFEKYTQVLLRGLAGGDEAIAMPGQIWKAVGKEVDMTNLIHRYTLDTATDFLFGRSVGSLQNSDAKFAKAFEAVQRSLSTKARAGCVLQISTHWFANISCRPAKRLFANKTFDLQVDLINSVAFPYIDAALTLSPDELASKSSDSNYTFLHALVSVSRDRIFLRDQIVSLLLAGRDTTAAIFIWIFYEISRNPQCYAKLRQEVLQILGEHDPPTYNDLKTMKYLQHTMNEAMRLYPLPFNVRTALKNTTLPKGGGLTGDQPIGIPKGTPIGFSTFNLHHREDLFPEPSSGFPAVDIFCPERWENWHPKPWTFIPFSGGPRICLGQQFALAEMGYTLARILQKFERIELLGAMDSDRVRSDIMLEPYEHLKVGFWGGKNADMG